MTRGSARHLAVPLPCFPDLQLLQCHLLCHSLRSSVLGKLVVEYHLQIAWSDGQSQSLESKRSTPVPADTKTPPLTRNSGQGPFSVHSLLATLFLA